MTTELVIAIAYQPGGLESFKRNLAKVIGITEVMSTIGESFQVITMPRTTIGQPAKWQVPFTGNQSQKDNVSSSLKTVVRRDLGSPHSVN